MEGEREGELAGFEERKRGGGEEGWWLVFFWGGNARRGVKVFRGNGGLR